MYARLADYRFEATESSPPTCTIGPALWAALMGLPDEVLFHPRLLPALEDLKRSVIEGDLADAVCDLVLNGPEI